MNGERPSPTSLLPPRPLERVCFRLQVDPARTDEYRQRHAAVWPDMLRALAASGWHNYSLFLDDDGLLIGYFETPSLEAALAGMADQDVNRRWQDEMAEFFVDLDRPADQGFIRVAEAFHLESQLAAAPPTGNDPTATRT